MNTSTIAFLAAAIAFGCSASPDAPATDEPPAEVASAALGADGGAPDPAPAEAPPPKAVRPLDPPKRVAQGGPAAGSDPCAIPPGGNAADSPCYAATGCVRGVGDPCGWISGATFDGTTATIQLTSKAPTGPSGQTEINGNRTTSNACLPDLYTAMTIAGGKATCRSDLHQGDDFGVGFEDCGHTYGVRFHADAAGVYRCTAVCAPCSY